MVKDKNRQQSIHLSHTVKRDSPGEKWQTLWIVHQVSPSSTLWLRVIWFISSPIVGELGGRRDGNAWKNTSTEDNLIWQKLLHVRHNQRKSMSNMTIFFLEDEKKNLCENIFSFVINLFLPSYVACTEEIKDIEFTVTTLNCVHNEESSPSHERHRRFNSLRKSNVLSRVVRNRLSKSLYCSNSNKKDAIDGDTSDTAEDTKAPTKETTKKSSERSKGHKKRSHLCLLLWPEACNQDDALSIL